MNFVLIGFLPGTCTVVIAMRSQFTEGQLPNETPFKSAGSDICSFSKMYQGLLEIDQACMQDDKPGWYETGKRNTALCGLESRD